MTDAETLLDPKNDFVFKKLFIESLPLLTDLINAIRHGETPIEVVEILNPRIEPDELLGKYIVLDVLARDFDGARRAGVTVEYSGIAESGSAGSKGQGLGGVGGVFQTLAGGSGDESD